MPAVGCSPSPQPEVEQKLYNTCSELAADAGDGKASDPKITAATANTMMALLFGMDVSTLEARFYLRDRQSEAIVALHQVVRKRLEKVGGG
jgi:hypothetical protein